MLENMEPNGFSQSEEQENVVADYLRHAVAAVAAGDAKLGTHLYLAAFEKAASASPIPAEDAINGLKQAWSLACDQKERSLAEYIFEKMEPFLTVDEAAHCTAALQNLALDKLEEYGISRAELEEMAESFSQDLLGANARVVKVEHLGHFPAGSLSFGGSNSDGAKFDESPLVSDEPGTGPAARLEAQSDAHPDVTQPASVQPGATQPAVVQPGIVLPGGQLPSGLHIVNPVEALAKAVEATGVKLPPVEERFSYKNLAGYGDVIAVMRDYGIGMHEDPEFQELVKMLNARHGLERMPSADTLLFRSPAREDAHRFMEATAGELGVPAIRMYMEENLQGAPMLCVMAQADASTVLNSARNEFTGRAVLLLEDIDLWGAPITDTGDDLGNIIFAQLSRGAREAVNLIRSAVMNPDVYVLASSSDTGRIEGFFLDMLEPVSVVEIAYPTPEERVEIWMDIAREHPSMRAVNRSDLVRYSAGMPRFDMYMAAREALEEAYKESLMARKYIPVTRENLFDKLAAYQPLDSREYRELEDAVVRDFGAGLDRLEDLLNGE